MSQNQIKILFIEQKSFEKRAQESLAKNRANQAKITGFNQKDVDQLTVYKEEYDDEYGDEGDEEPQESPVIQVFRETYD